MATRNEDQLEAWERHTAAPLTAMALVFLVAYAVPILWPGVSAPVQVACEVAMSGVWVLFGVDYAVRLWLAPNRWRFVRTHLFDLAALCFPMIRQLRVLRVVTAMTVINRRADVWTRGSLSLYIGATILLLVLVSGLAILEAERPSPEANITSYPEALWWAVVTVTTVGYGDHYPTTGAGQLVALALMAGGIGLIGFVTGSLATWIVDKVSAAERTQEATKADIATVMAELGALRAEVAALRAGGDSSTPTPTPTPTSTPTSSPAPSRAPAREAPGSH